MTDVVIIGGGLGGYLLATEISKKSPEINLTMLTADAGTYYLKPALSAALAQQKSLSDLAMFTAEEMAKRLNMKVIPHAYVERIDSTTQTIHTADKTYSYDKCILATGSKVIPLNLGQELSEQVFTVNSLADYARFRDVLTKPRKITVIGSGLVGVEFANDLAAAGHEVAVVGDSAYPLPQMIPLELGKVLQAAMQDRGITWSLNQTVTSINSNADKVKVECASGEALDSDLVLIAIGIRPDLGLAQASGLQTNTGIIVDLECRTSEKNIFAIGDCAEVAGMSLYYVPPIRKCAAAIAATLAGEPTQVVYPAMPVTVKSPACPIVACIPRVDLELKTEISGSGHDLTARYVDTTGKLHGFALSGTATSQKMELAQQIENWLG
ncbi:MAG: FAD-dependent oxidoreductase [Pseudomonadota bacterium]|nr:FAD-dependent oxidoreductase [Pseudomonadota bacterium]